MATSPQPVVIQYLALDADNDPIFDPTTVLTNGDAVAQAILTRLRLFLGEWWENLNLGLPAFQVILGQLASGRGQQAMEQAIQQQILGTPYVTGLVGVEVAFQNGQFSFTCTAQTAFGNVTVSGAVPGTSAEIGN
jgi:hypothetical protein